MPDLDALLLAYEVLTAFFLEAGFLGVMLFGWHRVGPGMHFFSTVMVALGTLLSMTWILASNSWMQTPQGYAILDGRIVPTDWIAVIFNPSFPYRLAHMGVAAFLATALIVGASGAWPYLRSSTLAPRAAIDAGAARHHRHHQPVAQYRAAGHLDLGGIVAAAEPGLRADRRAADHTDDPVLHGLELLGVPWQGRGHGRLSLMAPSSTPVTETKPDRVWWRRFGWMIVLWLAGVGAVALIALVFRGVMGVVGLTH